jgi:hypothetical protein
MGLQELSLLSGLFSGKKKLGFIDVNRLMGVDVWKPEHRS